MIEKYHRSGHKLSSEPEPKVRKLTYEFVIPSQVFLFDPAPWPSLSITRDGIAMQVQKPVMGKKHMSVNQTLGNEGVVVDYTILHVCMELNDQQVDPEWYVPFEIAKECLAWIRVAGRQYWLGVLMSASDSFARGSIICTKDGETTFRNFGASKTPMPPHPLKVEMWQRIGAEVASGHRPAIPDVMFCDALLSFRDSDYLQTVIQLGVTCELELNALIDDLLGKQTDQIRMLYNESRFTFAWKLKNMPPILGIEPYESHNERFARLLCSLYQLRGSAVHRAECLVDDKNPNTGKTERISVNFEHASNFVFAVEDFLRWAKEQRQRRA